MIYFHPYGYRYWVKSPSLEKECPAGCTRGQLKAHIESLFQPGMSWENYGEWEIDHITPVAFFDLSNWQSYLACIHFSNLQPLWKPKNIRKSNRIAGKKFLPRPVLDNFPDSSYEYVPTTSYGKEIDEELSLKNCPAGRSFVVDTNEMRQRIIGFASRLNIKIKTKRNESGRYDIWKLE